MTNSADLHCLQRQGIAGFSRTKVKTDSILILKVLKNFVNIVETDCLMGMDILWEKTLAKHVFATLLIKEQLRGPSCSNIVSLTNLLVVKMLTALISTISNSQVFLLKKYWHICHI